MILSFHRTVEVAFAAMCVIATGCGQPAPQSLPINQGSEATLEPDTPYLLAANTSLTATQDSTLSFAAADLFQPGDVIGEVVVIDNDALMRIAPYNERIDVILKPGQSMRIIQDRVITLIEPGTACRFDVGSPTTL